MIGDGGSRDCDKGYGYVEVWCKWKVRSLAMITSWAVQLLLSTSSQGLGLLGLLVDLPTCMEIISSESRS